MANPTTETFAFKPHHCGISVPDIEASIAWYQQMLGFSVAKREGFGQVQIVFMKNGDFYIELFQVAGAAPLPESRRTPDQDLRTHGTKHIAFAVDDLRKAVTILRQRGADIAMDGSDRTSGPRAVFIRDNSGVIIELVPTDAP
jgi:methylmalonyl-CoA/ethylmalonyl-CoA epimerase